ncbi:MAG: YtxH domain-containing protein [Bacteroidetes bacterium]|nr:YtxH domain-containing protein [Bacteroidota bacterium]
MSKTVKVLTALSIVAAAGMAIGALYAPDKGTRTRRKLLRQGKDICNTLENKIEEGRDTLDALKDAVKEQVSVISSKMAHKC